KRIYDKIQEVKTELEKLQQTELETLEKIAKLTVTEAKEELFIAYKQNPSYTTTISLANMFFELSEYEESYIMYIKSQSSLSDEALPDSISLKLELIKNKLISSTTNTNSNINFTLTTPSNINLSIFDINGQFVKTLYTGFLTKGKYELAWDGPSGIYIASLETENTLDAFTIKVQK
ncbi:MAG: FlgD immunoglobulin-like domain containing protein, partial [bacterium]